MEANGTKSLIDSEYLDNANKIVFDFRSQLINAVEIEWAKTNTNTLENNKLKRNKGKVKKKQCGSGNNRNFRSVDVLNDFVLEDQMVVDEKSEIIKSNRKIKIDEFTNGYEEIMKERGHCKDDGKLDG